MCKYTVNNWILDILLILFYNVFKNLKGNYMLNLTSSDKTSEILFHLYVIADLTLCTFVVYIFVLV